MTIKIKKRLALMMVLVMLFTIIPWPEDYVLANGEPLVQKVTIGKTYDRNRNLQNTYIQFNGQNLKDAVVMVDAYAIGLIPLTNRTVNTDNYLQFTLTTDFLSHEFIVGSQTISVGEDTLMPTLTGVDRTVQERSTMKLSGTELDKLQGVDAKVKLRYGKLGNYITMAAADFKLVDSNKANIENVTGELGLKEIIMVGTNVNNGVDIEIRYTYLDQFRLVQELEIDDLEVFPNRGEKGDTIYFRAEQLDEYDVFFLKEIDGTDPYSTINKGKNSTYKAKVEVVKGVLKDVLTVQVPDIPLGEYFLVLTNKISPGKDPMVEVTREKIIEEKFTVIDGSRKSRLFAIQPNQGPDSGSPAIISGVFLGSLNIDELNLSADTEREINLDDNNYTLKIQYSNDDAIIGTYKQKQIMSLEKQVRVIIGNRATFREQVNEDFTAHVDRLKIIVPQVTDAHLNPKRDVVVETTTFVETSDGVYNFTERAVLPNGYTFIPSMVQPEIEQVIPDKIQVRKISDQQGYTLAAAGMMMAIQGKNFMIHRFDDEGQTVVRYPIIKLGRDDDIILDKNIDDSLTVLVLDSNGNILDGSQGNETGTKIIFFIPEGEKVTTIGKTAVEVINPVRNSTLQGLNTIKQDAIEFVDVDQAKVPVIESVQPNIVATDGGEDITILGSNFQNGVKVYLDGMEVPGINREGDGKKITFKAPKGREGETQLQVMNPEGGVATWPFRYVKTYTDPKIIDFNPKQGNTGTLVLIKGDNFLKPDPAALAEEIDKLIGTRVLLQGMDVNEYNLNAHQNIVLQDYSSSENDKLIRIGTKAGGGKYLELAEYYHSVVLYDEAANNFYIIDVDSKGTPILSDGVSNKYQLALDKTGSIIQVQPEGKAAYTLDIGVDTVTILEDSLSVATLKIQTSFKVIDNKIIGHRVKVIDKGQLIFTVPILPANGWYDLTVQNPDTKKDSRIGQKGFYYYSQPQSRVKLEKVIPDQGSTVGGYNIKIIGAGFEDNGTTKSKVYINGLEVKKEETAVSVDGTVIEVKVPPYPGDLRADKGTDRLTVPVVVVNPDGASANLEDGFTYIVSTSYPQITKIIPPVKSAAGGEIVEIIGVDFRYFEPFNDANRNQVLDPDEEWNDVNGNGKWDDYRGRNVAELKADPDVDYDLEVVPVLPQVMFGWQQVEIVEFDRGYLKVLTPPTAAGIVDVYIINNDSGISNKFKFTFDASNPQITTIVPNQGKKQGKDKVEILGNRFFPSQVAIVNFDDAGRQITDVGKMMLVRFGNISNLDIPREAVNSGRIDSGRTTVNLVGGLQVEYDGINNKVQISVTEAGNKYAQNFDYDGAVNYFPLSLLKDNAGSTYAGYELIKLEIRDRRLLVERGYAPETTLVNAGQIVVTTPSYYTVGKVGVTVINQDGGTATGEFEYKNPASNPKIINLTKEGSSSEEELVPGYGAVKILKVTYKGGNIISVIGEDFRENATIQISNFLKINPQDIQYQLPNRLTFTMPAVPEQEVGKLYRLLVLNEDGASASSDEVIPPIYIMFIKGETDPTIENISPNQGPSSGGTKVTIVGKDFREGLSVYFGEVPVPEGDVTIVDYKTVIVSTPPHPPGTVTVRVENQDGELSSSNGSFTYISSPTIRTVIDQAENSKVDTVSILGGGIIRLKGAHYQAGGKVIFNPVISEVTGETAGKQNLIYVNGEKPYLLESGIAGTNYKLIDEETVEVVVPQGKLGMKGIIIVNPDGGASEIYDDLVYGLPELAAPLDVTAELVYDRYIKVHWNQVAGAKEYELFIAINDDQMEYVGSTALTSIVYENLKPNTRYKFIVKAVGDFGSSRPSAESNELRTGRRVGPPNDDGQLNEWTEISRSGQTANIAIGTDDYDIQEIVVDLTRGELAGAKEVIISIPARVAASSSAKDITVRGSDFNLKFNPRVFGNKRVLDNSKRDDAGIRLKVASFEGNLNLPGNNHLSTPYLLEADIFVGQARTPVDYLTGSMQLTLDYDLAKVQLRRVANVQLVRYEEARGVWDSASAPQVGFGNSSIYGIINRMGKYLIIGNREVTR